MGELKLDPHRISPEVYRELVETSEHRYEYEDGLVIAMGATTDTHDDLAVNLRQVLKTAIKGRPCRVHSSTVKLALNHDRQFYLPDVMLTCDERDLADRKQKRYPSLVAEVISPSSEGRDRGEKFHRYLRMPSLQYYLLLVQHETRIDLFSREERGWVYQYYDQLDDQVELPKLDLRFSVGAVYDGVPLIEPEPTDEEG